MDQRLGPESHPLREDLEIWKLVRSSIEHENTLKNYRTTWLLATQLFLFSAFSAVFVEANKDKGALWDTIRVPIFLLAVGGLGIFTCALAWVSMSAANKQVSNLEDWFLNKYHNKEETDNNKWTESVYTITANVNHPPINGIFRKRLYVRISDGLLPLVLALGWVAFILISLINAFVAPGSLNINTPTIDFSDNCTLIYTFMAVLLLVLMLYLAYSWLSGDVPAEYQKSRITPETNESPQATPLQNPGSPQVDARASSPPTPPTPSPAPPPDPAPTPSPPPHHQPPGL